MTVRVITLGDGRPIGLGAYMKGLRACMAAPEGTEYKRGLTGWWPVTREEILRDWRASVHDRINRNVAWFGRGRKWDADYQRHMRRDGDRINRAGTERLVVQVTEISTPGWRERYAHRLEGASGPRRCQGEERTTGLAALARSIAPPPGVRRER